jgi:hypothetical protein
MVTDTPRTSAERKFSQFLTDEHVDPAYSPNLVEDASFDALTGLRRKNDSMLTLAIIRKHPREYCRRR